MGVHSQVPRVLKSNIKTFALKKRSDMPRVPSTSWTATAKVPWGGGGERPLLPWAPCLKRDPLGADDHPAGVHSEDSLVGMIL